MFSQSEKDATNTVSDEEETDRKQPERNVFTSDIHNKENSPTSSMHLSGPSKCELAEQKGCSSENTRLEQPVTICKKWKWLLKKYKNRSTKFAQQSPWEKDSHYSSLDCHSVDQKNTDFGAQESRINDTSPRCSNAFSSLQWNQRFSASSQENLFQMSGEFPRSEGALHSPLSSTKNTDENFHEDIVSSMIVLRGNSPASNANFAETNREQIRLRRGASASGSLNPVSSKTEGRKVNRTGSGISNEREPKSFENDSCWSLEKGTSRTSSDKRRLSKITTEVRDKFSVFQKSGCNNAIQQNVNTGVVGTQSRTVLNRIFRAQWPSPEEVEHWSHSFEHILHDKCGILVFREFLRTEFSDENIEFWLTCEDFRNCVRSKKLQNRAQKIFNEFVAVQAKREVNLDSTTRLQLEKELESVSKTTFDQSQKRIQALMEKDSYARFLRSDLYMTALEMSREQPPPSRSVHTRALSDFKHWRIGSSRFHIIPDGQTSSIPALLPNIRSPKQLAGASSKHDSGSLSAPSSPKH